MFFHTISLSPGRWQRFGPVQSHASRAGRVQSLVLWPTSVPPSEAIVVRPVGGLPQLCVQFGFELGNAISGQVSAACRRVRVLICVRWQPGRLSSERVPCCGRCDATIVNLANSIIFYTHGVCVCTTSNVLCNHCNAAHYTMPY